ncbi:MAG: DUF1573 domain-containing protein [Kiritimatiellae bacterium]|nr:DUF1573 domain-containing protein [Kiritimatiellia bacterium]
MAAFGIFGRGARPARPRARGTRAHTILFLSLLCGCAAVAESMVVRVGRKTEIVSAPKYGIDLGTIDQHRIVDCSFAITNNNWRERAVLSAYGNCACLSVDVERKVLKRGEACPVKVLFNPAGFEGPVDKLVTVQLDGKKIEYPIKANVRLRLGFRPLDANFGVVAAGQTPIAPIVCKIAGTVAGETALELVPPEKPYFDVKLEKGAFSAAFREGMRYPGLYAEVWRVKTSDLEIPELRVNVSARVSGGLSVSPQAIELRQEDGVSRRQVLIRPEDVKHPLNVLSAETKPRKWGDVTLTQRPLNGWQISIQGIDPEVVRQFSKRPFLEITTDFPGMEKFAIPLLLRQQ